MPFYQKRIIIYDTGRCNSMKGKAIITAVILIIVFMLSGCDIQEVSAGTDVYSKPLFSDTSIDSLASGTEVDVSHKHSDWDTGSNETDSDNENKSEANNSSAASSTVSSTEETTFYYYYYENEESEASENEESSESESDSEKNDTDSDSESDSAADPDTDTDTSEARDSETTETDSKDTQTDTENTDTETTSFEESDLEFVIAESRIKLGDNISDHEEILGELLHITDTKDAEGEIIGRLYSYEDFSIDTVYDTESGDEIIAAIEIFSDNIVTEKDIKIGDSIQKVYDVYGSDWMRCEDEYRYYIGNSYMYFYVQNDIVANIGYKTDKDMEDQYA